MNLNNLKDYKKLDSSMIAESIEYLPDQFRQALRDGELIKIPKEYARINKVAINGMGGSNLGGRILQSCFKDIMKAPLLIEPGYQVPAYVDQNTLFILSSYSGTTEETLSVYKEVKKRGAKILAITAHGKNNKLEKIMLKDDIPGYIFHPEYNPSKQPRLGLGYSIFGTLVLIAKSGLLKIKIKDVEKIIANLEIRSRLFKREEPENINFAKSAALKLYKKIPILVGAQHLTGNLHAMRNQINECSKSFCAYLELPELNHYAMEGLIYPAGNKNNLVFFCFDSKLYHKRIQKRSTLSKEIIKQNKIEYLDYELQEKTKLGQCFELLQLGSWVSYYLGMLYNVDPVKIPYVDWFKEKLK
jgi:glucose/mannose-6-phosphate isomerase